MKSDIHPSELPSDLKEKLSAFFSSGLIQVNEKTAQQVEIRHSREGNKFFQDKKLTLGYKVGPKLEVQGLLHEMAHLVEIDDRRALRHGWGLKVPEVFIYNRMCIEPTTIQMCQRECRVLAYQLNLEVELGFDVDEFEAVSSLRFLPDFWLVPGGEDGKRQEYLAGLVKEYCKEFTYKKFCEEWAKKLEILKRNWKKQVSSKQYLSNVYGISYRKAAGVKVGQILEWEKLGGSEWEIGQRIKGFLADSA